MRFSKVDIPEEFSANVGLNKVLIGNKQLGPIVALVGKNGSGKSRILKLIEKYNDLITNENFIENCITEIPERLMESNISKKTRNAQKLYKEINNHALPQDKVVWETKFKTAIDSFLPKIREGMSLYIKKVDPNWFMEIREAARIGITFEDMISNNEKFLNNNKEFNEFSQLSTNLVFEFIQKIANKDIQTNLISLYNKVGTETGSNLQIEETHELARLKYYLKLFLGKDLIHEASIKDNIVTSIVKFDGINFDFNKLSPGQKTLFSFSILFYLLELNTNTKISESIIIIDEPEKSLHPEAQIKLIKALRELVGKKGQLWIATHSVHILAHLNIDEIFMVRDGKIIDPSRITPSNSFIELMGLNDHVDELKTFINSVSEWAFANFLKQCFSQPDTIFSRNKNDEQFKLFKEFIVMTNSISVLDFGAGKGRFGYMLSEDEDISKKVQYDLYTITHENDSYLKSNEYINKIIYEKNEIENEYYDVVVLCNVLHEIHPDQWIEVINTIKNKLKHNGYFIFMEDKHLPKGEVAHNFGYLILNETQVSVLLGINENECLGLNRHSTDNTYSDRLVFIAIPSYKISINRESIKRAITGLNEEVYNKIKSYRADQDNASVGRLYANNLQLYMNSKLCLEYLEENL